MLVYNTYTCNVCMHAHVIVCKCLCASGWISLYLTFPFLEGCLSELYLFTFSLSLSFLIIMKLFFSATNGADDDEKIGKKVGKIVMGEKFLHEINESYLLRRRDRILVLYLHSFCVLLVCSQFHFNSGGTNCAHPVLITEFMWKCSYTSPHTRTTNISNNTPSLRFLSKVVRA